MGIPFSRLVTNIAIKPFLITGTLNIDIVNTAINYYVMKVLQAKQTSFKKPWTCKNSYANFLRRRGIGQIMWGRQWFDHYSQMGLEDESLEAEFYLQQGHYHKAYNCVINLFRKYSSTNQNKFIKLFCKRQIKRIAHVENFNHRSKHQGLTSVRLGFIDFWNGFSANSSPLYSLIKKISPLPVELESNVELADIIICSCFGNKLQNSKNLHATRILYIGENLRPQYSDYDYSLSFDRNSYCGRNINLPLWMLSTNIWGNDDPSLTSHKLLTRSKLLYPRDKKKGINIITNNFTPFRLELINKFRRQGFKVDIFGQHFNPVVNKISLMSDYAFSLCPENSVYPGYVTEKIIHASSASTLPIYSGGIMGEGFDLRSFLYIEPDLSNFEFIVSNMNELIKSPQVHLPPLARQSSMLRKSADIENRLEIIFSLYFND